MRTTVDMVGAWRWLSTLLEMTAFVCARSIGGIGSRGGTVGPRKIGLDIAGEGGSSRFQMPSGGTSFGDHLKKAIGDVSAQQDTAQDYIQRFVSGQRPPLSSGTI